MNSIRRRLTIGLLTGLLLLLGGGAGLLYQFTRAALYRDLDHRLLVEARAITTVTKQEQTYIAFAYTDDRIVDFDDRTPTRFYQLWHPDGSVIQRSRSLRTGSLPPRFGSFEQPQLWNLDLPDGSQGRAVGIRFVPDVDFGDRQFYDPELKLGLVVAGARTSLEQTLAVLRWALVTGVTCILAACIGLVFWVLAQSLRPLDRLASAASEISVDSLDVRFPTDQMPTELRPIASALNQLLGRLQISFDRERQFSNDIAHELRTPVAELQAVAELALKWPAQVDPEAIHDVAAIGLKMESIVTALGTLSRIERDETMLMARPVLVRPVLDELLAQHVAVVRRRQLRVEVNVSDQLSIGADPTALMIIAGNLIDNAFTYTPAGGTIEINGKPAGEGCELRVMNNVVDLHASDLPRMFDRFWRKDAVRSGTPQLGLGLAICRACAAACGLALTASLVDGRLVMLLANGQVPAAKSLRFCGDSA